MTVMVVAVFPSIQASSQLDELINAYPDALKEAFGISDASFSSISGYLAAEIFSMIAPFTAAAFIIHAVATGISGAEHRGVLDVTLSAPAAPQAPPRRTVGGRRGDPARDLPRRGRPDPGQRPTRSAWTWPWATRSPGSSTCGRSASSSAA